jgi:hypothetical protein
VVVIKDIIREKLSTMDDLKQRSQLKKVMQEVFMPLIEHQNSMQADLEEQVFNELEDKEEEYDIYTTMVPRSKLKLLDNLLFPILEEDQEKSEYDKEELIEKINNQEELILSKIFLKKNHIQIKKIEEADRAFEGEIVTEEGNHKINLELNHNTDYLEKEKELHNVFLENCTNWRTINNPYIRKFFNIVITDYEDSVEELTDFKEITFDLEELESDKYVDYIPVWNIKRIQQEEEGFPLPAIDKIHYNHEIFLENLGFEHGYLVVPSEESQLISIKKIRSETGDKLVITSNNDQTIEWELLQVIQKPEPWNEDFEFELLTNQRKQKFMNKLTQNNYKNIKTFAELNRLANSFLISANIKLEEIDILDELDKKSYTYDFNFFIEDEIRINNYKKIMLLTFSGQNLGYLKYDLLSFIVSEIQNYFPEYLCKGVFSE